MGFNMKRVLWATLASTLFALPAAAERMAATFSPAAGVKATLSVNDRNDVELSVESPSGTSTQTLAMDTEKELHLDVMDYNFDGHKDFSISHVDDGMGTYQLFEVYVYSVREGKFLPLAPRCGEAFINLVVAKRERVLINSYMVEGRYKTCRMKF